MVLILERSKKNELKFEHDSGSVVLYYSTPTTKQRIQYSNSIIRRRGGQVTNELAATRLAGGKAVCTGMREGDFAIPADNDRGYALISSDPQSPDYRPDWLALLAEHQADYLMLLGAHAFESTAISGQDEDDDVISLDPVQEQADKDTELGK